jgi:hypothetical protein
VNTEDIQNTPVEDEEIEVSPFDPKASEKIAPLEGEKPEDDAPREDVLDIIQPQTEPKTWVFNSEMYGPREYVQEELSLMRKIEWGALLGDVLDKAMSGPNALSLGNLFAAPDLSAGRLDARSIGEADVFVQAVGKLVAHSPNFLRKSFAIWLNVPDHEREIFTDLMNLSPAKGGLSDDQGFEIIERFLDQNWPAIEQMFTERVGKLRKKVEMMREQNKTT